MLQVEAVDHVVYVCDDVERVLAWWTDVVGVPAVRVDEWHAGTAPFPSVRLSGSSLLDFVAGPRTGENVAHIALAVATPMADVLAWARENAVDVVSGPRSLFGARGVGEGLYVRDPEGNVVELRTYV
jgi:catechol 2,3-dioxygenase-like lactoylglutathione lyase family enzyme